MAQLHEEEMMFPPRERGWSLIFVLATLPSSVSPARAGMVPLKAHHGSICTRFPRASGDGPLCQHGLPSVAMFPPRERGWSHVIGEELYPVVVSPARAGMVPQWGFIGSLKHGFPRASGDGPFQPGDADEWYPFPPRERGWSRSWLNSSSLLDVSPARAGMVPMPRTACSTPPCFPRASGDGPPPGAGFAPTNQFPPRERGWSHPDKSSPVETLVSPARAGMVPEIQPSSMSSRSFPRASGDGPMRHSYATAMLMFPPRERGWSLAQLRKVQVISVSPARAGMVPDNGRVAGRFDGFPRASGDAGRPSPTYYGWLCSRESLLRPQPAQEDSHAKAQKSP